MQSLPAGSCAQAYSPSHKLKPVERRVLGDPGQAPVLQRFRACKISNAEYRTVVGLKQETIQALIPGEHQQALREKSLRKWVVRHFEPVSEPKAYNSGWARSLTEPAKLPLITSTINKEQLSAADAVQAFVLKTPDNYLDVSKQTITIPHPSVAGNGKQIVLFNGNAADDPRAIDIGIICSSRKVRLSEAVWLKKGDAVVLESQTDDEGHEQWRVVARKVDTNIELETNPLVRMSGEVQVDENNVAASVPYDGEFFMPLHKLQGVLERKLEKQKGFDWACCEDKQALCAYLQQLKQRKAGRPLEKRCTGHFVFEDKNSNHTIAARIHVEDGRVLCFIQDGMGWMSTDALRARKKVIAEMQKVFPHAQMAISTPFESFQLDYESCGIVAAKAMTFFAKHGEQLDAQLEEITLTHPGEVNIRAFHLSSLPAGLLKMCQTPEHLEGLTQLDEVVSQKQNTTLGEYLASYRARMHDDTKAAGFKWAEAAALAKRYQYFGELFGVVAETSEAVDSNAVDSSAVDSSANAEPGADPLQKTTTDPVNVEERMIVSIKLEKLRDLPKQPTGVHGTSLKGTALDRPYSTRSKFLFYLVSSGLFPNIIDWENQAAGVVKIYNREAVADLSRQAGGYAKNYSMMARSLRLSYQRGVLNPCGKRNCYRFNLDNDDVKSWKADCDKRFGLDDKALEVPTLNSPKLLSSYKSSEAAVPIVTINQRQRKEALFNHPPVAEQLSDQQEPPDTGTPSSDSDELFGVVTETSDDSEPIAPPRQRRRRKYQGITGHRLKRISSDSKDESIHQERRVKSRTTPAKPVSETVDSSTVAGSGTAPLEETSKDPVKTGTISQESESSHMRVSIKLEKLRDQPKQPTGVHGPSLKGTALQRPFSTRPEFLFHLVSSGLFPKIIDWEDKANGIIKIYDREAVADLSRQAGGWARSYEMLYGSLRLGQRRGELIRCSGQMRYRFNLDNDKVKSWKAESDKIFGLDNKAVQAVQMVEVLTLDSPKPLSSYESSEAAVPVVAIDQRVEAQFNNPAIVEQLSDQQESSDTEQLSSDTETLFSETGTPSSDSDGLFCEDIKKSESVEAIVEAIVEAVEASDSSESEAPPRKRQRRKYRGVTGYRLESISDESKDESFHQERQVKPRTTPAQPVPETFDSRAVAGSGTASLTKKSTGEVKTKAGNIKRRSKPSPVVSFQLQSLPRKPGQPIRTQGSSLKGTALDRTYSSRAEFLFHLVSSGLFPDFIGWKRKEDGLLQIYDSKAVASLSQQTGGNTGSYEALSRTLRYRYSKGEFIPCDGHLRYRFNLNNSKVKSWKAECDKMFGLDSKETEKLTTDSQKPLGSYESSEAKEPVVTTRHRGKALHNNPATEQLSDEQESSDTGTTSSDSGATSSNSDDGDLSTGYRP